MVGPVRSTVPSGSAVARKVLANMAMRRRRLLANVLELAVDAAADTHRWRSRRIQLLESIIPRS